MKMLFFTWKKHVHKIFGKTLLVSLQIKIRHYIMMENNILNFLRQGFL